MCTDLEGEFHLKIPQYLTPILEVFSIPKLGAEFWEEQSGASHETFFNRDAGSPPFMGANFVHQPTALLKIPF